MLTTVSKTTIKEKAGAAINSVSASSGATSVVSDKPLVSVLMPAHNAGKFITAAISSILAQDFEDFVFYILNDGSTDNTGELIDAFAAIDSRVVVLTNEEKGGILAARDTLLDQVGTPFFAWMDADDMSSPDRFSKQLAFLNNNQDIGAVGGSWKIIGSDKVVTSYTDPEELRAAMFVGNPFHNPVMMVRSVLAKQLNFRYKDCGVKSASDFSFVLAFAEVSSFSTIPDVLYHYRVHDAQESTANNDVQKQSLKTMMLQRYERYGVSVPEFAKNSIRTFGKEKASKAQIKCVAEAANALLKKNKQSGWFNQKFLRKHLGINLKRLCQRHGMSGLIMFIRYFGVLEVLRGKQCGWGFIRQCLKQQ